MVTFNLWHSPTFLEKSWYLSPALLIVLTFDSNHAYHNHNSFNHKQEYCNCVIMQNEWLWLQSKVTLFINWLTISQPWKVKVLRIMDRLRNTKSFPTFFLRLRYTHKSFRNEEQIFLSPFLRKRATFNSYLFCIQLNGHEPDYVTTLQLLVAKG